MQSIWNQRIQLSAGTQSAVYLGPPLSEYVSQSPGLTFLAWTAYSKDSQHHERHNCVYNIVCGRFCEGVDEFSGSRICRELLTLFYPVSALCNALTYFNLYDICNFPRHTVCIPLVCSVCWIQCGDVSVKYIYQEVLTLLALTIVSLYLYSFYDCFYWRGQVVHVSAGK